MHVVTRPIEPFSACGGALVVHAIPAATDNLVWLAVCPETGEAAVVDGPSAAEALPYAEAHGIRITAVLNTHTHGDHVGINHDLIRMGKLPARVAGPRAVEGEVPGITEPVDEGDHVAVGRSTGRVLRTDGHIFGHVCYLFGEDTADPVLFCGDTLFAGGCGYLFTKRPDWMFDSLLRLAALPGPTRVCCAHEYTEDNLRFALSVEDTPALRARVDSVLKIRAEGGCTLPSTIELERATNPFLRPGSPQIVAAARAAEPDLDGANPAAVFAATRRLKDAKGYRSAPWPPST